MDRVSFPCHSLPKLHELLPTDDEKRLPTSHALQIFIDGLTPLTLASAGKSNILDSICFVLGITNLTQVRAKSLQDLIYKNGQAGITKVGAKLPTLHSLSTASTLR